MINKQYLDLFPLTWDAITNNAEDEKNYWASKGLLPLGTVRPYYEYNGKIPMEDIITVKFDPSYKPFTERSGFNFLILGDTGDGKSLLMKLIWSVLADASYWCIYVDSKSTDCGRAKLAWSHDRLPPKMQPKGIKLRHYMPYYATRKMERKVHNFDLYSLRLKDIYDKEMWMGLGATSVIASKISNYIQEYGNKVTIKKLTHAMETLKEDKEIYSQSITGFYSLITTLEDSKALDEHIPEMQLFQDLQEGYSVCISYNKCSFSLMSFDVGEKINRVADSYNTLNRKTPVMFFLDDASLYAKEDRDIIKYNLAVEQIKNIGFNYRALGINQVLAVQTLNIIDQDVKDGFQYKIITPKFAHPESLRKINVPEEAILMLKAHFLKVDKEKHLMQYMLVDQDNKIRLFYPFAPPCNHFKEVYFDKEDVVVEA